VPDVTGLTVAAAIDLLNDEEGFDVGYGRAVTTENIVTHQKPKAGTFLPRGLPVTVICTVRVPNVQGQGVRDGSDQIGDAGLVAEFSVPADSSNFVFAQNPRAGSTVEVGAVVTLVPGITAPNLINMGYNAAQQTLVASSIRGQVDAVLTQQVAVTGPIATTREPWIIWQRPQPGAPMAKSDVLHVKVGRLQGVVVNPLPVGPAQPAAGAVCPECRKPHGQCTCNRGGGGFGG
jgi:beta-lactam-binding protein with PASTA domain